jgi:hypothetical protein
MPWCVPGGRVELPTKGYEETGLPGDGEGKDLIKILTALSALEAEASCLRTFMGFNTKI